MKILHVLISHRAEGTPRLVLDWLTVSGYEQELLFLSDEGNLKSDFLATKVWQYYNTSFNLKLLNAFKIAKLVHSIAKERKPDMVISWPMGFSQWIHLGARLAGVKALIVYGGNPPGKDFLNRYVFTYLSFWIGFLLGNKVLTCSDYILNEFHKIPFLSRGQFLRVYNCFSYQKFQLSNELKNQKQAIMVATLETHKDHETLLHAWQLVEKRSAGYQLKLAGGGRLERHLKDLATNLNLTSVEFLGSRSDVPKLLQQSKIFVFSTTEQEGFGTVLLEALASGCNIVAADVPACREALQDGQFGTLIPPRNPVALSEAILSSFETVMTSVQLQSQIDYVLQFTPLRMIHQYLEAVRKTN